MSKQSLEFHMNKVFREDNGTDVGRDPFYFDIKDVLTEMNVGLKGLGEWWPGKSKNTCDE